MPKKISKVFPYHFFQWFQFVFTKNFSFFSHLHFPGPYLRMTIDEYINSEFSYCGTQRTVPIGWYMRLKKKKKKYKGFGDHDKWKRHAIALFEEPWLYMCAILQWKTTQNTYKKTHEVMFIFFPFFFLLKKR